jgi:hypothetical protein
MNVILESKLINVQNTKQPLSDRKQIEMPKKGINSVASSNCKLSSLSPKRANEFNNKSLLSQPNPEDLISWLASDNSFVMYF